MKVRNFKGSSSSEGNHTTPASCKSFPDVVSSPSTQGRKRTTFIQDWDFAPSMETQWKREIDMAMRIDSLPTESKKDRARNEEMP